MSILMYGTVLHNHTGVNSNVPLAYLPPKAPKGGGLRSGAVHRWPLKVFLQERLEDKEERGSLSTVCYLHVGFIYMAWDSSREILSSLRVFRTAGQAIPCIGINWDKGYAREKIGSGS